MTAPNILIRIMGLFDGSVKSMDIQCAFCHSTVDNSFVPGTTFATAWRAQASPATSEHA